MACVARTWADQQRREQGVVPRPVKGVTPGSEDLGLGLKFLDELVDRLHELTSLTGLGKLELRVGGVGSLGCSHALPGSILGAASSTLQHRHALGYETWEAC